VFEGKDHAISAYCRRPRNINGLVATDAPINPVPGNAIPGNSKAFKVWWVQQCAADPSAHELAFAAVLAFSTLQTRELNRDPFKSRAVADLAVGALGDFTRLWAAHTEARP
jgi:hypothetical protein